MYNVHISFDGIIIPNQKKDIFEEFAYISMPSLGVLWLGDECMYEFFFKYR